MASPRYKPRSELQTRGSESEVDVLPDFAATALDRPAATQDDLRQAQLKQYVDRDRRSREANRARGRGRVLVGLVVVGAVTLLLLLSVTAFVFFGA